VKGDLPRSLRALSTRLSWGALAFSAFSLFFYAAAGFRSYGEAALNQALLASGLGAAVALCAALSAAALDLASPLFKQPIQLKTLISSLLGGALALTLLLASSALRAVFGGLSL
jgi:hypothetical protein